VQGVEGAGLERERELGKGREVVGKKYEARGKRQETRQGMDKMMKQDEQRWDEQRERESRGSVRAEAAWEHRQREQR
jgi:hypothetical protein